MEYTFFLLFYTPHYFFILFIPESKLSKLIDYDNYSDLCRKKKIKCDGLAPICSNCQTFSLQCTYKDTTKKVSHYHTYAYKLYANQILLSIERST